MHYHFRVVEEKEGGYSGRCLEKGMNTGSQGDTWEEFLFNLREALNLALDEPADSTWIPPMPGKFELSKKIIAVPVDPKIALATMLRVSRLKSGWAQRTAAEKMGIKHLRQYQILESGKSNPGLATLAKIKKLFPKVSIDAILSA